MQTKTKAIVLRSLKYGEAQLIVDMLTEETGRVSFVCHIPKTAKGKMKKQLFQPMTLLEIAFDHRPQVTLQRLKDIRLLTPFASIPFDANKLAISLFLAEFLYYGTRDEQLNRPLFNYIENSIEWLDNCQGNFANFHLVFMLRLSRFVGFFPNVDDYKRGCLFDLREGAFTLTAPLHPDFLSREETARIIPLMRMDYTTMHLFRMSHEERNRCIDVLVTFYRLHVPNFPELKSLSVLREMYEVN